LRTIIGPQPFSNRLLKIRRVGDLAIASSRS
jgi:hypothetical protein